MDKHVDSQIFVGDVYDLAAEIGKEFEKLIDVCGADTIRELMTKVIVTLEYLESSTVVVDRLQSELYDIRAKVQQLEYEKLERAEFRSKLDQELEIIEENWRKETSHLNSLVVKLQEENKRLSAIISEKDKHAPSDCKTYLSDEELVVVQKLKELTEQHRGQLILKDKELLEKSNELEKMQLELDRLSKANKELSHRNRYLQKQLYTLVEEKSDLQANIQTRSKRNATNMLSKWQINLAVKENMDLSSVERQISWWQGPINKEPEDKLYPEKKKLGIRRFFHFLRRISVDSPVPLVPFSASHR
ncbi:RILP-like protein like protein [Argiope bruennichi]|uniref:RILP-like protein like protein n=1 Tax=Argiope bruennichi TaxID=94029 RepID=A0A8T0F4Q9_ARGBR|nr:RILP-like protein like protein [Argiope bruennichi]